MVRLVELSDEVFRLDQLQDRGEGRWRNALDECEVLLRSEERLQDSVGVLQTQRSQELLAIVRRRRARVPDRSGNRSGFILHLSRKASPTASSRSVVPISQRASLRARPRAGAHLHRFLVLVVVLDYVYCLLHIAEHEIAVTVVSLQLISLSAPGEAV